MTLEEYIKEQRERVANMTLAQARQIVASHYGHDDMRIECEKAVWMLLNCADEKINGEWIPVAKRLPNKLTNVNIAFDDCPNEYDVAYLRTTVNETYRKNGAENEWVSLMGEATYADYEVSAWMEIKPYKAESEVSE